MKLVRCDICGRACKESYVWQDLKYERTLFIRAVLVKTKDKNEKPNQFAGSTEKEMKRQQMSIPADVCARCVTKIINV